MGKDSERYIVDKKAMTVQEICDYLNRKDPKNYYRPSADDEGGDLVFDLIDPEQKTIVVCGGANLGFSSDVIENSDPITGEEILAVINQPGRDPHQ